MKYSSKILLLLTFTLLKNIALFSDLSCPHLRSSRNGKFLADLSISKDRIKVSKAVESEAVEIVMPYVSSIPLPHYSKLSHFAITTDGKKIAYCLRGDKLIHVVNSLEPQIIIRIESKHSGHITDLAWSEHNEILASCSSDGTVKLWKKSEKKYLTDETNYKFAGEIERSDKKKINSISWGIMPYWKINKSPAGGNCPATTLACGFDDGSIKVWWVYNITSYYRSCKCTEIHDIPPYTGYSIKHIEFHLNKFGTILSAGEYGVILAVTADNSVRLFNTDDMSFFTIREHSDCELLSVSFSSFGRYIVLQTKSHTQIWNYKTKTIYKTYETPNIISVALVEDVIDGEPSLILVMKDGYNGNIERIFVR